MFSVFQQYVPPLNYSIEVRDYLNRTIPNQWIAKSGTILWPSRSTEYTSWNYFSGATWKEKCAKIFLRAWMSWETSIRRSEMQCRALDLSEPTPASFCIDASCFWHTYIGWYSRQPASVTIISSTYYRAYQFWIVSQTLFWKPRHEIQNFPTKLSQTFLAQAPYLPTSWVSERNLLSRTRISLKNQNIPLMSRFRE